MALDNFRTQKIIWDRANKKIFEAIEANSGDSNGRKLVVQVINQEVTESLSGTTLSLGWKSRNGAKGLDAFNLVDASKGIFEIYYTTEMLSNIGNIEASLILIDSTSRIESSTFTISVRPSTVDDESIESENSFTALTEALVKVNDFDAKLAQTETNKVDKDGSGQVKWANIAQDAREQISGDKVAVVGVDGVITENIADNAVTYDKTDFADEISIIAKNIIKNGNFSIDGNGDGVADGWFASGAGVSLPRVSNNTQYWTPLDTSFGSTIRSHPPVDLIAGHKYYVSLEHSNVKFVRFPTTSPSHEIRPQVDGDGKRSDVIEISEDGVGTLTVFSSVINVESSIKNVMVVDLTETFGVGNEPDLKYFEYLLDIMNTGGWFGGALNLTDSSKNGIITAKELKIHDPDGTINSDNVNEALIDLTTKTSDMLYSKSTKNIYNPDNNESGELFSNLIGTYQTTKDSTHVYQRIKITNKNDVTFKGIRLYSITNPDNIVLKMTEYVNPQETYTISTVDMPDESAYLWVSTYPDNANSNAQVEIGSVLSPYEPYKKVDSVYAGNVKIFDYPLLPTSEGGNESPEQNHQIALARLENERLKEEMQILKSNTEAIFNVKMNKTSDREEISLNNTTSKQKIILHLHKRGNEGYDTNNDVYLPNAEDDFSDIKVTSRDGSLLPYRVSHYAEDFDVIADSRIDGNNSFFVDSNGKIIAVYAGRISMSEDDGVTWTPISSLTTFTNPVITLVSADDTMFFNRDGDLYRSEAPYTDYTQVFNLSTEYSTQIVTTGMVQHPDGEIFFGTYQIERHIKIYKSIDNGLTWNIVLDVPQTYQHVHAMYVDLYSNPVAIYAGVDGGGGVYKTTDKGTTWVDLRAQNPDMPQSTDYGVIYSDPSGYRLLGGETAIVGGHSILKTVDDVNFKPVLSVGSGIYTIQELNGKLYAGGVGTNGFQSSAIYMSEDEGESWEEVYTTSPLNDTAGASDGFRNLKSTGEQILVSSQSASRSGLRILPDGKYAEIIVDVPAGTSSVVVESGYAYTNIHPIHNDTDEAGDYLVKFNLNEGGKVIKETVGEKYYEGAFEWLKTGKRLSNFYPYITLPSEKMSISTKSLKGYKVDSSSLIASEGITISFWAQIGRGLNLILFQTDLGDTLEIVNGYQLHFNGKHYMPINVPIISGVLNKIDLTVNADGRATIFSNGHQHTTAPVDGLGGVLTAITNSEEMTVLNALQSNPTDCIQHFSIRKGVVSREQLYEEFNSYITDNME